MSALDMFPETRVDPGLDLDRRYTTPETMSLCMKLAGVDAWDLDVAADEEGHWAERWYGVQQDGLRQPWFGRVWCNPPFSDLDPWVRRANYFATIGEAQLVALLLPANRTEQPFWQNGIEPFRDGRDRFAAKLTTHFLPTRVRYGHPGNARGHGAGSPPFASVLLLWRRS